MSKKIGIITLPLHHNYGGVLQAFALQKYLKGLGHKTILIDRRHGNTLISKLKMNVRNVIHPDLLTTKEYYEAPITEFTKKYISPKSEELHSHRDVYDYIKEQKFDALVSGSDQAFRIDYAPTIYKELYLDFELPIKKLSYAASFGHSKWMFEDKKKEIKQLLKNFTAISVREEDGVKLCKDVFDVEAFHHVDPTLLLSRQDYLDIIAEEQPKDFESGLLTYVLDQSQEVQDIIKMVHNELRLPRLDLNKPNVNSTNYKDLGEQQKFSVTDWLAAFNKSQFIVTDSFHGTIFSIIFQKPFVVIGNKQRGISRFLSLLKMLNIEDNLIYSKQDLDPKLRYEIDYESVNQIIEAEKIKSFDFFQKALK